MARRKSWGPGNPLYDWKMRNKGGARRRSHRGSGMARSKYGRRKGGGGAFSMNRIIRTVGFAAAGAFVAPMVGQSPAIGGAVGGALGSPGGLAGKAIGAGIGLVAGAPVANAARGLLGMGTGNGGSSSTGAFSW